MSTTNIQTKILTFLDQYALNPVDAFEYLVFNIELIGYKTVFDIYFNKVLNMAPDNDYNMSLLLVLIKLMPVDAEVKLDTRYIKECQSNIKNYQDLFEYLITYEFAVDVDFVILSVCARGELQKLKLLLENYEIKVGQEEFLFKVALYYGRYEIVEYLHMKYKMPINTIRLTNLGFLNNRYVFYSKDIEYKSYHTDVQSVYQDYDRTIEYVLYWSQSEHETLNPNVSDDPLIPNYAFLKREPTLTAQRLSPDKPTSFVQQQSRLGSPNEDKDEDEDEDEDEDNDYHVNSDTLHRWIAHKKLFTWDKFDLNTVLPILMTYAEEIPLTADFGEWNNIIFGQYGNRSLLIEKITELEQELTHYREIYGNLCPI